MAPPPPPQVDFLPHQLLPTPGRLGLTHLPGIFFPGRPLDSDERLLADLQSYAQLHHASRLVTLLDRFELAEVGRLDLVARRIGIRWTHFPITDMSVPRSMAATSRCVGSILRWLQAGESIIVHCRAGLGRSGLLAACVLVARGMDPDAAIEAVRDVRQGAVEAEAQEVFVRDFARWREQRRKAPHRRGE